MRYVALDPGHLSRNELVQLLNSTDQGEAMTRPRLERLMNRAGRRWHDGRHIDFVRFMRWMVRQVDAPLGVARSARDTELQAKRDTRYEAQNIGPLPEVANERRRAKAKGDFRFFCETYFPEAFYRAWSNDHLRVISKIEHAVTEGGLFAFAMPRGRARRRWRGCRRCGLCSPATAHSCA